MDIVSTLPIMFLVILGFVVIVFIFSIVTMFSPKWRAKMLGKQVKTMSYMINDNEDLLKDMSTKGAEISSEGIEITAKAISKGIAQGKQTNMKFCKHCGQQIEEDSHFCKYCGKEQ